MVIAWLSYMKIKLWYNTQLILKMAGLVLLKTTNRCFSLQITCMAGNCAYQKLQVVQSKGLNLYIKGLCILGHILGLLYCTWLLLVTALFMLAAVHVERLCSCSPFHTLWPIMAMLQVM